MDRSSSSRGLTADVDRAIALWRQAAGPWIPQGPHYATRDQQKREEAYDLALHDVERQARQTNRFAPAETQRRLSRERTHHTRGPPTNNIA